MDHLGRRNLGIIYNEADGWVVYQENKTGVSCRNRYQGEIKVVCYSAVLYEGGQDGSKKWDLMQICDGMAYERAAPGW